MKLKRVTSAEELANLENGAEVIVVNKNPERGENQAMVVHGYLEMQRQTCGIHMMRAIGLEGEFVQDELDCEELVTDLRELHERGGESAGGAVYSRDTLFKEPYFEVYHVKQRVAWLEELGIRLP